MAFDPKPKHKGQRLCFIAGILSDSPSESHVLGLHVFTGGKKQVKDYHGMFHHRYYVDWFSGLLDQLDAIGKTGVVIVLDNASYHKGLPDNTPKGSWAKDRLLQACNSYGIMATGDDRCYIDVGHKVKAHIKAHARPVIMAMAEARGHTLIELLWAYVKGRVGRQYTTSTTFADVRARLDSAFDSIPSEIIFKCIIDDISSYNVECDASCYTNALALLDQRMREENRMEKQMNCSEQVVV
ncbi:hypothetical protein ACHHYP_20577 [Achlya hypogyna]|uniref:Tc1-like transposase DDE domain-containing protein n=1 Tax=Achlya hypogyna TaxID=1202772 RepID=A0A1V9YI88_ACHHY|nr:hypothetical protein ACHHYP_20577 [Achlya hypogyna]